MGVDFISKTKKSFQKGLDESRVKLGTTHLFSIQPDVAARTYSVTLIDGHKLRTADQVGVRLRDDGKYCSDGRTRCDWCL